MAVGPTGTDCAVFCARQVPVRAKPAGGARCQRWRAWRTVVPWNAGNGVDRRRGAVVLIWADARAYRCRLGGGLVRVAKEARGARIRVVALNAEGALRECVRPLESLDPSAKRGGQLVPEASRGETDRCPSWPQAKSDRRRGRPKGGPAQDKGAGGRETVDSG